MQGVRLYRSILFISLLSSALLFTYSSGVSQQRYTNEERLLMQKFNWLNGQPFADLELENEKGEIVHTSSLSGKTLYIDFWFTTCSPCIKEISHARALHNFFAGDTNVVFLNICIENIDKKDAWKKMVAEKHIGGVNLFYARNRPQKINLLRKYNILFPTYLLVDKQLKVIGYDAPRPSEKGWVHWAIHEAANNVSLSDAYKSRNSQSYKDFMRKYGSDIERAEPAN
jgi:thiol-disulfide isomerase/thioredoxin